MALSAAALAHLNGRDKKSGRFQATKNAESIVRLPAPMTMAEARVHGLMARWPEIEPEEIDRVAKELFSGNSLTDRQRIVDQGVHSLQFLDDVDESVLRGHASVPHDFGLDANPRAVAAIEATGIKMQRGAAIEGGILVQTFAGAVPIKVTEDGGLEFPEHFHLADPDAEPLEKWKSITSSLVDMAATDRNFGMEFKTGGADGQFFEAYGTANFTWTNSLGQKAKVIVDRQNNATVFAQDEANSKALLEDFKRDGETDEDASTRLQALAVKGREQMLWNDAAKLQRHHLRPGLRDNSEAWAARQQLESKITAAFPRMNNRVVVMKGTARLRNTSRAHSYASSTVVVDPDGSQRLYEDENQVSWFEPGQRNQQKLLKLADEYREELKALAEASRVGLEA